MDLSQKFQQRLQTSADEFLWAVELIPRERHFISHREKWSVARIIFHLVCYEQRIGLPSLQQWLGGPLPLSYSSEEDGAHEEEEWNGGKNYEEATLIAAFKAVRNQQLALLPQLTEDDWYQERAAIWGKFPLHWVVTKTYQHTLEHTDELLRSYPWWR